MLGLAITAAGAQFEDLDLALARYGRAFQDEPQYPRSRICSAFKSSLIERLGDIVMQGVGQLLIKIAIPNSVMPGLAIKLHDLQTDCGLVLNSQRYASQHCPAHVAIQDLR